MASQILTLSDPSVLCEYADINDIKGFFQQRVAVGPDLLAVLIRDGKVAHASHGAHIALGGFWRSIKDSLSGTHALRLLVADLKPFQAQRVFSGLTRDKVPVQAEVTLELQVNPEQPAGVLGFASDTEIVLKEQMMARLAPQIADRVFGAVTAKVDALDLRGDVDVQNKVQAEIMTEAERIFGDMGMLVRAVSLNWAFNEEELTAIRIRAEAREQEVLDAKFQNLSREIERTAAITTLQIETKAGVEKAAAASDAELEQMVMNNELDFVAAKEARNRAIRMEALQGEIAELKVEQQAKFENALAETQNALELKKIQMEIDTLDRRTQELNTKQQVALTQLQQRAELEIAAESHEQNLKKLRDLQDLDHDGKDRTFDRDERGKQGDHDRKMDEKREDNAAAQKTLELQSRMTPEQALAAKAGVNEAGQAMIEKAKAEGANSAEMMKLMERLIAEKDKSTSQILDQAKHGAEMIRDAAVGVAGAQSGNTAKGTIICPRCRTENDADAAFCKACRTPLRGEA